jgi:sec-independent protein translocase protein TatB
VFGLGFEEMILVGIVLIVVIGPRELPRLLRGLGRSINKLRNMSTELRKQSGIDDIIEEEGLREDIDAIRSLSRARILDGVVNAATRTGQRPGQQRIGAPKTLTLEELALPEEGTKPTGETEYPALGCDAYGALADDAPIPEPEPAKEAATVEEPVIAVEPVAAEEPVVAEEPVAAEEPVLAGAKVTSEPA